MFLNDFAPFYRVKMIFFIFSIKITNYFMVFQFMAQNLLITYYTERRWVLCTDL